MGVLVELTLFPMGLVFGMGPLIKKIVCLYVFPPDPTPFPGIGELCSNYFFQNITFVSFIFFCFFLGFKLGDRSHISWIDIIINYKWYKQGKI